MHNAFLQQAIDLSREKMLEGEGGPFAALVVKNGAIIGAGWNRVTSSCDPTAHAEIMAIRDACQTLQLFSLEGCSLYSSCEPCPMCLAACYWARLDRIYFAANRSDAAQAGFDDQLIGDELHLPAHRRRLVMQQSLREPARAVFERWLAKSDRTPY